MRAVPRSVFPAATSALLIAAALTAGCAGKSGSSGPPAAATSASQPGGGATGPAVAEESAVKEQALSPAKLDPAADKYPADQYAYRPATSTGEPRLVVYLVGKGNTPERGRAMGRTLAALGFLVLVPGYANDYDIRQLCEAATVPDADCHSKLRTEAFEGRDLSPHITVTRPNSLEARVGKLLSALAQQEPNVGWQRFLVRERPRWEGITVAGHSHGASSAALVGKLRRVERVVMLSGPFDNRAGEPAPWLRRPGLTPVDRLFGFSHAKEEQYPGHIKNWDALELDGLGPVTTVESAASPAFGGSHQLVTAMAPEGDANPHGMTTAGKASPRVSADGPYRFTAVWRYLFGI